MTIQRWNFQNCVLEAKLYIIQRTELIHPNKNKVANLVSQFGIWRENTDIVIGGQQDREEIILRRKVKQELWRWAATSFNPGFAIQQLCDLG